jgi:hypothetical protein
MEVSMDLKSLLDPKVIALVVAVVVVVVVVAALAWRSARQRRAMTADLRKRFGSEYDQAVREHGSVRRAETQLAGRAKRVKGLNIRDLDPASRDRFSFQWQALQSRFVDEPKAAVAEADTLVTSVMQARGYPVADFNQRAADISVLHPHVVANYRSAHAIAARLGQGDASTEELRTAMIHFRSLFDELMHFPTAAAMKEVA